MTVTLKANVRRNTQLIAGKGDGATLRAPGARVVAVTAPTASGSILDFNLRIPVNARIDPSSRIYFDDLATSGTPTLNLGLYPVDGNTTTTLTTALASALAISAVSAAGGIIVPASHGNGGKKAWDLMGLTTSPGGFFDIKGVIKSATTNGVTGNVTLDLKYYED